MDWNLAKVGNCSVRGRPEVISCIWAFLVFGCYATTQLATPLQQRRIQVVRSNKVAQKRLTEAPGWFETTAQ